MTHPMPWRSRFAAIGSGERGAVLLEPVTPSEACGNVPSCASHNTAAEARVWSCDAQQPRPKRAKGAAGWSVSGVLPDGHLSGEGFLLLLLQLQLGRLQAQRLPGLHFLDAAIAAPAFLHLGWQPATAAFHRVAAGDAREGGGEGGQILIRRNVVQRLL